jgi:hypothetical protein
MSAPPEAATRPAGRTQALQYRFTAHIRDPENKPAPDGIEDRRMAIYRDLVYANMESFIASNFPVIRTLFDDAAWDGFTHEFFREHRCHTPLFPEFAREFLRWLELRQEQDRGDPPWLLELAHYEWAELALSLDQAQIDEVPHDRHGDVQAGVPMVSPLACVLGYHYPVQHIGPEFRPPDMPAEPTWILLVRGRDDDVRFHEINALSAMLIERLRENTALTGALCLDALLAERPADEAAALRPAGLALLLELRSFEAILGTRGAAPQS